MLLAVNRSGARAVTKPKVDEDAIARAIRVALSDLSDQDSDQRAADQDSDQRAA